MQNIDKRKVEKQLSEMGYERVRSSGSSHVVYERKVTVKDTVSLPMGDKTINGPMWGRIEKQMRGFESWLAQGIGRIKD